MVLDFKKGVKLNNLFKKFKISNSNILISIFKGKIQGILDEISWQIRNIIRGLLCIKFWIRHPIIRLNADKYIPNGAYCYGGDIIPIKNLRGDVVGYTSGRCIFQSYYDGQLCLLDCGDCIDDSCKTCGKRHCDGR